MSKYREKANTDVSITEPGNDEPVSEELKETLDLMGTITLKFYYLENAHKNENFHLPRRMVDGIGTVSEKAVKGQALSHQMRYSITFPLSKIFLRLLRPELTMQQLTPS